MWLVKVKMRGRLYLQVFSASIANASIGAMLNLTLANASQHFIMQTFGLYVQSSMVDFRSHRALNIPTYKCAFCFQCQQSPILCATWLPSDDAHDQQQAAHTPWLTPTLWPPTEQRLPSSFTSSAFEWLMHTSTFLFRAAGAAQRASPRRGCRPRPRAR